MRNYRWQNKKVLTKNDKKNSELLVMHNVLSKIFYLSLW